MSITADKSFFQEGDHIQVKNTHETGRINAIDAGVVYVLMDNMNESRSFPVDVGGNVAIEHITARASADDGRASIPFSEHLSEQWLLERTYHARLRNGRELSVSHLTEAMKRLFDFSVPISMLSWKSKLPETLPLKKSSNFYVPIATWREITQEEAHTCYQQGIPVLLYGEHAWEHSKKLPDISWQLNHNMSTIIYGNNAGTPEGDAGTEYAVCYLDSKQGTFSNSSWKTWFSSDTDVIFEPRNRDIVTFLRPCVQFPFTTHYTVIAADGHVSQYADPAAALAGFSTSPVQEEYNGNTVQSVAPDLCYYHAIACPDGIYCLEFFGSRMDESGYPVAEIGKMRPHLVRG